MNNITIHKQQKKVIKKMDSKVPENALTRTRSINEIHFNAINSNLKHKISNVGNHEEQKKLLPSNSSRKFIIVPAHNGNNGTQKKSSPPSMSNDSGPSSSSNASHTTSPIQSPLPIYIKPKHSNSMRSVRSAQIPIHDQGMALSSPIYSPPPSIARSGSYIFSDCGSTRIFSDAVSVRSLASIGMGSTDGRKMVIRRVPNSPTELLSIISPPT